MSAVDEKGLLDKAEAIVQHLSEAGTLSGLAGIGEAELEAVYAVAYNHFAARKYDQAIDLFKFLCLYDHNEPRWFYGLGAAQQGKQDYAAAIQAYGLATILDVDDPRPQTQAGYCLLALEKWPEAQSALEGALMTCGQRPQFSEIRRQAENLLATARKHDQKGG